MGKITILCLLALNLALLVAAESTLEIKTSPEGPAFLAASWIRLACKYHQDSDSSTVQSVRYNWRVSCRRTGEIVYNIRTPMMDEEGWATIWVHSTPLHCLDFYQCNVYRSDDVREGQEIASKNYTIERVTGVGMSLYQGVFQGTVPNNSIVVVEQHSGVPREILCQSGLLKTSMNRFRNCSASWLSPSSSEVGTCARSLLDVENEMKREREGMSSDDDTEMEMVFNSVRVDFDSAEFEEGLYSCKIEDEHLEENQLFVGVYKSVPELAIDSSYKTTQEGHVMSCDTMGIPPTAVLWYKDDTLISSSNESDSNLQKITKDDGTVTYRHSLIASSPGIYSCDVRSTWITADRSSMGRISSSAFFVLHPSSPRVNLECAFPEDSASRVEWVNDVSAPVYFELLEPSAKNLKNNTAKVSLFLDQDSDNHVLTCKGVDQSGRDMYKKYTIIIDPSLLQVATDQKVDDTAENTNIIGDFGSSPSMIMVATTVLAGLIFIIVILVTLIAIISCVLRKKKRTTSKHPSTLTLEDKDSKTSTN